MEWLDSNFNAGLEWAVLTAPNHQDVQRWVQDLNRFYRTEPYSLSLTLPPLATIMLKLE